MFEFILKHFINTRALRCSSNHVFLAAKSKKKLACARFALKNMLLSANIKRTVIEGVGTSYAEELIVNTIGVTKFQVFIDGVQAGNIGRWKHAPLMVASQWDAGGDQEKYEVLAAIRRTYNADDKNNIRGNERQTPSQVGRAEGFTELRYRRAISSAPEVIIVSPMMPYRRLVPQPEFKMIDSSRRAN